MIYRALLLITVLGFSCAAQSAESAPPAASVVLLTGQATALGLDGSVRRLSKNDAVYGGDLINSGVGSYVNLKFADGAFFLLRPETRFVIEQYQYQAKTAATPPAENTASTAPTKPAALSPLVTAAQTSESSGSRAFFRLVKGGFRSVSGLIGKINRDDYRVATPVATIGIRGTRYSARICEGSCEDRTEIVTELQSAGKSVQPDDLLLVTTVDEGSIELESAQGSVIQNGCAGSAGAHCGALFTAPDGSSITLPGRPATENKERSLDPASCD